MLTFLMKEGVSLIANRLKILLAERDLSIKNVMEATGISRSALSNMVNNPMANIATDNIDKLCNYLEVSPKDFFDYCGWRFKYELVPLYSSQHTPKTPGKPETRLQVTMTSGKMSRTFFLHYVLEYNMDYGDGGYHDVFVTAYDPDGCNEQFLSIYKQLSPLFQHQIESELLQPVPVILELADRRGEFSNRIDSQKNKINVQFVCLGENDPIFVDTFLFNRKVD